MNRIIILALVMFTLAACESPKEKALKNIKGMEGNDSAFSNELMTSLKAAYLAYVADYPDDEFAPEFMFKAAQRTIALNQAEDAVEILGNLVKNYPKSPYCEEGLFLMAYTTENNLNNLPKAKEYYEKFLASYPNGELAKDARFALDNLGKSPEELLDNLPDEPEE